MLKLYRWFYNVLLSAIVFSFIYRTNQCTSVDRSELALRLSVTHKIERKIHFEAEKYTFKGAAPISPTQNRRFWGLRHLFLQDLKKNSEYTKYGLVRSYTEKLFFKIFSTIRPLAAIFQKSSGNAFSSQTYPMNVLNKYIATWYKIKLSVGQIFF